MRISPCCADRRDAQATGRQRRLGAYETRFLALMAERQISAKLKPSTLDGACLLCSEATAHHCHRRLVCEYLNEKWAAR